MNKQEYLQKITTYFAQIQTEVVLNNAISLYDINRIFEDAIAPILKIVYKAPSLINLNIEKKNYPAIDLGCLTSKIAFQITSTNTSDKLIHTLEKYKEYNLNNIYDRLVIVIVNNTKSSSSVKLKKLAKELNFDIKNDVCDMRSLLEIIAKLTTSEIQEIFEILRTEMEIHNRNTQLDQHLDKFLKNSLEKVEQEKNSKKYIPEIFIETTSLKQKARFFAHPQLFYNFIIYQMQLVNFDILNQYLTRAGIEKIAFTEELDYWKVTTLPTPDEILRIQNELQRVGAFIKLCKRENKVKLEDEIKISNYAMYEMIQHSIMMLGYSLDHKITGLQQSLKILSSRVFIITSSAGQGKTNFLCDFTENFCAKHSIPTVYIPAKELNGISNGDIFEYIKNKPYLQQLDNKFHLLDFAQRTAAKTNLPFVIILDGINELKDHESFRSYLDDFIEQLTNYSHIKLIITCRTEFYSKFYSYTEQQENLRKITWFEDNISANFTSEQRKYILDTYFKYYNITGAPSEEVLNKLSSNFLLLRIFCDTNLRKNIAHVTHIPKTELFYEYVNIFVKSTLKEERLKEELINVIYNLVEIMIRNNDFSQIMLSELSKYPNYSTARQVIDELINNEILFQQELSKEGATKSLTNISEKVIRFTFDELRDYFIANYITTKHKELNLKNTLENESMVDGTIIFLYLLAREQKNDEILNYLETTPYYYLLYVNALSELPYNIIDETDIALTHEILARENINKNYEEKIKLTLCNFLIKNDTTECLLNIPLLTNYINNLKEDLQVKNIIDMITCAQYSVRPNIPQNILNSLRVCNPSELKQISIDRFILYAQILSQDSYGRYYEFREILEQVPEIHNKTIESLKNANAPILKEFANKLSQKIEVPSFEEIEQFLNDISPLGGDEDVL